MITKRKNEGKGKGRKEGTRRKSMIAEVIVNSSASELNRVFDYTVPEGYEIGKNIEIGYRVLVSFARRKQLEIGYIIGFKESSTYQCKLISKVVDKAFEKEKINILKWMAKRYFCNLSDVFKLVVPPGTSHDLEKVKVKMERFARMCSPFPQEAIEKIKSEKQKRIITFLQDNPEIPTAILYEVTGTTPAVLKALEDKKIVESFQREVLRNPFTNKHIVKDQPLCLTEEQEKIFERLLVAQRELTLLNDKDTLRNKNHPFLLHGVTGSGKTEVYLQLISQVIAQGKNAIVLVPEISLTPQMTNRFLARFGRIIAILHSKLSQGERFDEWRRIQKGDAKIVIGARSALFAPVSNVGVIILDEEHDSSYKSETNPKYDAREVAEKMAKEMGALLLFASATPDVRTYYRAMQGEIELLELKNRISKNGMPAMQIVDMREELASGNRTAFSRHLYQEMKKNIANKEQTILFLNRRGYSTFVICRDCGFVVKCDKCDVSMTYHATKNKLLCHYCGAEKENVSICPECGSKNIRYFGTGTQKIEAEIHKYFPEASVLRMDVDTTGTKNAHEMILNRFKNEKVDILLGTQMITKGHDFENVTLVGVLAADSSINIADYRAAERTYQLLTQVAGRAGRGDKKGRAIIQTYLPDEFSIVTAQKQEYTLFYTNEINVREKLNFPPFCDIIIGVISGEEESLVKQDATLFYQIFQQYFTVYPPIPAPIPKINNSYRYRILIKAKITEAIVEKIQKGLTEFDVAKQKESKLTFDINPNSML